MTPTRRIAAAVAAALAASAHAGVDLAAIDRKADACGDFYRFANGAWLDATPIPPDLARWGSFDALAALQMPAIFGGAIVTEQIFRVPGIGSLLISAILSNDTPVIMAVTFVFACLVIFFNLLADVLYGWLDPRISYR